MTRVIRAIRAALVPLDLHFEGEAPCPLVAYAHRDVRVQARPSDTGAQNLFDRSYAFPRGSASVNASSISSRSRMVSKDCPGSVSSKCSVSSNSPGSS